MGRKCICNGLPATVGLAQERQGKDHELALLTSGNDVSRIAHFLRPGRDTYTAAEVIESLLAEDVVATSAASPTVAVAATISAVPQALEASV